MKSLLACGTANFALGHSENYNLGSRTCCKKEENLQNNKQSERPHWIGHCKMQKAPEV